MSEWRYVKPLVSESVINDVETKLDYKFCNSYITFVKKYNGGRPPIGVYNTNTAKGRTIKSFLSLNTSDEENIIKLNTYLSDATKDIIAFAIDSFGNYICFEKSTSKIVFFNSETEIIEFIANDFDSFLKNITDEH